MHIPQTEVNLRHDGIELARVTLPPGEYVIGRNPDAEIFAETPLISRRHAQLTINYDHLLIEDLGSSNGTFVNEQPIAEATRLFPNQAVRLGDVTVELHRERAPSEPDVSLAPAQAAIRRFLPDELLAEKRYAIGSVVARGGMGAILDARQTAIDRTVAMKVMLETGGEADVLRFIDEAKITGQLDHPNIVPIYELGVDEQGQLFYTMKMVRGITLKKVLELLAQGIPETVKKFPLSALLTIFQKVCDALAFAHAKGVIHRDLKPENIMLGDFGSVLVMDWGLAKVISRGGHRAVDAAAHGTIARSSVHSARTAEPEFGSTLSGTIMGTPQYMSPEQARGEVETLDARSDIYALGAILYSLLALRPSVTGRSVGEIVDKVGRGEIEPLVSRSPSSSRTGDDPGRKKEMKREGGSHLPGGRVPDSLAAVVGKAMALDPVQRYWQVEELQADVAAYQAGRATSAENAGLGKQLLLAFKRHKIAATGIAAALLVGAALGTGAILEELRAERAAMHALAEAKRAELAVADLKKTAPALLALAESEAGFQRFDSALQKLDAALALDPALRPAYWQRAWMLIGQEQWSAAADTIRLAQQKDPAHAALADILPTVEEFAAAPEQERWVPKRMERLIQHLQKVGASGELAALSGKLQLGAQEKRKLVEAQLTEWLGPTQVNWHVGLTATGLISVLLKNVETLEPLRGLPIDEFNVSPSSFTSLEPLDISDNPIADYTPLLQMLKLEKLRVTSGAKKLEPLRQHRTLKFIANGDAPYRPVAEFWAAYDAQQKGAAK